MLKNILRLTLQIFTYSAIIGLSILGWVLIGIILFCTSGSAKADFELSAIKSVHASETYGEGSDYEPGQGYPTFDPDQAQDYFNRVNERVASLIEEVIRKWDAARLYR